MDDLLAAACLGIGIFTWWRLARRMKQRGRGWLARQLAGGFTGLCAAFLLVVATGIVWAAVTEYLLPQPTSAERKVEKSLGLKPAEYAARINPLLEQLGKPYRVNPNELGKGGTHDILSADMGPHATLAGRVSRATGELLDVMLIDNGDGKTESEQEIHQLASVALASAMNGVDPGYVFNQLPELLKGNMVSVAGMKLGAKDTGIAGTWYFVGPN